MIDEVELKKYNPMDYLIQKDNNGSENEDQIEKPTHSDFKNRAN